MLRGVALVIGNRDYQSVAKLVNPDNDAREIAKLLHALGFETRVAIDRLCRDLGLDVSNFINDANGCDVAMLYYAGHGIEAGGENFLVPVDADISALKEATRSLFPVSDIIARLRATVPIVVVLLDACRNNPFPPNAMVWANPDAQPNVVGTGGLVEPRDKFLQRDPAGRQLNLGTVIGFAAAPGKVASDGAKRPNSPYAASLVRHFSAIHGEEFGSVMRMVSEEVYLKTGGRQRPWINENLRRFLYFGSVLTESAGEEAEILSERRRLLLTIAATPQTTREYVEILAKQDGLPLDQLYGMLNELEVDTSFGREGLESQLREGARNLRKFMVERVAPIRTDPDLVRLTSLADRAQAEGAIRLAKNFRAKASARADYLRATLDRREDELKADRLQLAGVYADHAETAVLNFDYQTAAEKYADAFGQAAPWSAALAASYKLGEAEALAQLGYVTNSEGLKSRAMQAFRSALRASEDLPDRTVWAEAQNGYANALQLFDGEEVRKLTSAIEAYQMALTVFDDHSNAGVWVRLQNNLGSATAKRGNLSGSIEMVDAAVAIFRTTLSRIEVGGFALERAQLLNNLGNTLKQRWQQDGSDKDIDDSIAAYRSAVQIEGLSNDRHEWAKIENNLGLALQLVAESRNDTGLLLGSIEAFEMALKVRTRGETPLLWATTVNNLAYSRILYGRLKPDLPSIERALAELHNANAVLAEIGARRNQAYVEDSLGTGYSEKYTQTGDRRLLGTAQTHFVTAKQEFDEAGNVVESGNTEKKLRAVEASLNDAS